MVSNRGVIDALEAFGGEQIRILRDALASELHNEGYLLSGNTEDSDLAWFARWLHTVNGNRVGNNHCAWDRLEEVEQASYMALAQLSIECLPFLVERIANRYISASKALRFMQLAEEDSTFDHLSVDVTMLSESK